MSPYFSMQGLPEFQKFQDYSAHRGDYIAHRTKKGMHPVIATCLLLLISAAAMLPAFPILIYLQNYFPDVPDVFSLDTLAIYLLQASAILVAGLLSMCVYSDVACPFAMKGYAFVFSNM